VVQHAASGVSVGCDALALLARIQAVAGALSSWAAQHLFVGLERPEQLLLAWSFFVAWFGVSLVLAWAFSRSLLGVSARPWRVPGVSSPG
jgi:hypothetical protein